MRLAPGLVARAWLPPLTARADARPTSHDVQRGLEAGIAALEGSLHAHEATSEAALTAASARAAAKDPMFRLRGALAGSCTRAGYLTVSSLDPVGWSCIDLSVYSHGLPAICVKISSGPS